MAETKKTGKGIGQEGKEFDKKGCFLYKVYQEKIIEELAKRLGESSFTYRWKGDAQTMNGGNRNKVGGGDKMGDFVFTSDEGGKNVKVGVLYSDITKTKDITNEFIKWTIVVKRFKECVEIQKTKTTSSLEIDGGKCSMAKDSEYTWIGSPLVTEADPKADHWGFIFKNKTGEIYYKALLKGGFTDFITNKLAEMSDPTAPPGDETNKGQTKKEKEEEEKKLRILKAQLKFAKKNLKTEKKLMQLKGNKTITPKNIADTEAEIKKLEEELKSKVGSKGGGGRRTRRKRRRRKKKKTVRRKKKRRTKRKRKRVKRKTRRRR